MFAIQKKSVVYTSKPVTVKDEIMTAYVPDLYERANVELFHFLRQMIYDKGSWSNLEEKIAQVKDIQLKGKIFQLFGCYQLSAMENVKICCPRNKMPDDVCKNLGINKTSEGYDAVMCLNDGKIYGVKFAFRSKTETVNASELQKTVNFYSANKNKIDRIMFYTNCQKPNLPHQLKSVTDVLDKDHIQNIDQGFYRELRDYLWHN